LTIQTGGRFYYVRNDLDRKIAQGAEQGRSYYTLAYTPAAGTGEVSQAYRHLRIVVNRPTPAVQAKHGYYAGDGADAGRRSRLRRSYRWIWRRLRVVGWLTRVWC